MRLLQSLHLINEAQKKAKDVDLLPKDAIKDVKKLIKDGAEDTQYEWANVIELVNQAFKIAGVEKPTPSERAAWQQYEELLQYGVKQMADNRSEEETEWRMSSKVFREAMERQIKVRVYEIGSNFGKGHTVEAKNMEEVINMIRKQAGKSAFDMNVSGEPENGECTCSFSYQGVQRPYKVKLQRL